MRTYNDLLHVIYVVSNPCMCTDLLHRPTVILFSAVFLTARGLRCLPGRLIMILPFYLQKWTQSPKAFQVIASNDCSNWDTLLSVNDSGFTGAHQEKSWQIPCNQQKSYHCYGIEGNENFGFHTDYISVHKMKMFQ